MLVGLVRNKAMALMLGPAGFGMMGTFMSILDLARSFAAMGMSNSGVRQIAQAVGTEDQHRIAVVASVVSRTALVLGLLGALPMVLLSEQISQLSFGDVGQSGAVALLSVALFLRLVAEGQTARLQGMRRIGDLARIGVLSAVLGCVAGIPIVYLLGEKGIVPSLIAVTAVGVGLAWWFNRRLPLAPVGLNAGEFRAEAVALLKLGVAFMASGLLMMGVAYVVRIIVLRGAGLEAAGLYQAAYALGGLYVGLVLQAMGTDFYPRLVSVAEDHPTCNRLVNEQAHVSLLLAGPGVIATIALAPWVLGLLYSREFVAAADVLRWTCLGMALRVVTWPIGYIIVAKGVRTIFFLTELAWSVVSVLLAWWGVQHFGVAGAGMAFFGAYVFHAAMIYPVVRRLSGFRWSAEVRSTVAWFFVSIAAVFTAAEWLPAGQALGVGLIVLLPATWYAVRSLLGLMNEGATPRSVSQCLGALARLR